MASFCERNELPKKNSFENETFIFLYFKTEKECLDAQPSSDFFINCHSEINFLEESVAEIILTDIIWRGEYKVENKNIIVTFEDNYEVPDETIVFQIMNKSKLKRLDDNTVWNKMVGNSIWD